MEGQYQNSVDLSDSYQQSY